MIAVSIRHFGEERVSPLKPKLKQILNELKGIALGIHAHGKKDRRISCADFPEGLHIWGAYTEDNLTYPEDGEVCDCGEIIWSSEWEK